MRQRKFNSGALRRLAEELLGSIPGDELIPEDEREDFVTSLVRQWVTYDGRATMFVGEQQVYLVLGKTPLGKPCVVPEPASYGWTNRLREDWKISPDDLPEVINQLNRGQSAEVINADGIPLRLWVDPRERSRGVEPLVKENIPPRRKRDYRKIAVCELEKQFGPALDADEMEALACSLAKQWQQHEGYASLVVDAQEQFDFKLTEHGDGTCDVVCRRMGVDFEPLLSSLGLAPEAWTEVIARINLGQQVELRDSNGVPSVLWLDPRGGGVRVRSLNPAPPAAGPAMRPFFCPRCGAVLSVWEEKERQQTCPLCRHPVRP
jgi:hypothetical protein